MENQKGKKILFVTMEAGGNVPPVLGMATRLAARGHDITVLSEPCLQELIRANGLQFLAFKEYFTKLERVEDSFKDAHTGALSNPALDNVIFGSVETLVMEALEAIETGGIEILVVDMILLCAVIAGEKANIPTVVLCHFPEYLPGKNRPPGGLGLVPGKGILGKWRDRMLGHIFKLVLKKYLGRVNAVRKNMGLYKIESAIDLMHMADLRIIMTSLRFDFPIRPAPSNVLYIGPLLDLPDWIEPWESPWDLSDTRPLVVVSLSTTFQDQHVALQHCIDALGEVDVRGVVTLGPVMSMETFDVPSNVVLLTGASHDQIFQVADLVVTHAGHGTLMRALIHGLPVICLPMGRDQDDNAAKVRYHGAGLSLDPNSSVGAISKCIEQVINDKSYKENAQIIGKAIKEDIQIEKGLEAIEKLVIKYRL